MHGKIAGIVARVASILSKGHWLAGYEPLFIEWVRSAFKAKSDKKSINKLMAWSERVSKLGREKEKQFLY